MGNKDVSEELLLAAVAYGDLNTDREAAEEFDLSVAQIRKARKELKQTPGLAVIEIMDKPQELMKAEMVYKAWNTLNALLDFGLRVAENASPFDPLMVASVDKLTKTVSEVIANREVLDVWLQEANAPIADNAIESDYRVIDESEVAKGKN